MHILEEMEIKRKNGFYFLKVKFKFSLNKELEKLSKGISYENLEAYFYFEKENCNLFKIGFYPKKEEVRENSSEIKKFLEEKYNNEIKKILKIILSEKENLLEIDFYNELNITKSFMHIAPNIVLNKKINNENKEEEIEIISKIKKEKNENPRIIFYGAFSQLKDQQRSLCISSNEVEREIEDLRKEFSLSKKFKLKSLFDEELKETLNSI